MPAPNNRTLSTKALINMYSWTPLIRTRLFRIPRYFELQTISLGFALQSFTIGYLELSLFRTILRFPWEFEIVGFNFMWTAKNIFLTIFLFSRLLFFVACFPSRKEWSQNTHVPPLSRRVLYKISKIRTHSYDPLVCLGSQLPSQIDVLLRPTHLSLFTITFRRSSFSYLTR